MKTIFETTCLVIFLGFVVVIIVALAGCHSDSGSGGGSEPPKTYKKTVCQNCSYDYECETNRCAQFNTGTWRCVPQDANFRGSVRSHSLPIQQLREKEVE